MTKSFDCKLLKIAINIWNLMEFYHSSPHYWNRIELLNQSKKVNIYRIFDGIQLKLFRGYQVILRPNLLPWSLLYSNSKRLKSLLTKQLYCLWNNCPLNFLHNEWMSPNKWRIVIWNFVDIYHLCKRSWLDMQILGLKMEVKFLRIPLFFNPHA